MIPFTSCAGGGAQVTVAVVLLVMVKVWMVGDEAGTGDGGEGWGGEEGKGERREKGRGGTRGGEERKKGGKEKGSHINFPHRHNSPLVQTHTHKQSRLTHLLDLLNYNLLHSLQQG